MAGVKITARDFFREKKGIHSVTVAILLITLIVVTAGVIYLWMMVEKSAGNSIYIQSIVSSEGSKTKIYVQNIGNGTVTIDSVQINGTNFKIYPSNCTVISEETTIIEEGQTAEITINQAYKEEVHISVVCKDGTFHELDWRP